MGWFKPLSGIAPLANPAKTVHACRMPEPVTTVAPHTVVLPIAVALLEDEIHVRTLFEKAIGQDPALVLVFSAHSVADAIAKAKRTAAQVYLVDLGLPDGDGREFIRWVSDHQSDAHVMVITVFGDDDHIVSSFSAGATGYLLKDTPLTEIAQRIAELRAGGSPISPSVARRLIQRFIPTQAAGANPLSERELNALRLLEKGLTYDEVASAMGITWHTVTSYLRRVYKKLQVNSRSEAVFEARVRGIL